MKPAYKLTPTQRANRRKYEAYTNAQRAYFRITYGLGDNAQTTIEAAGPEAVAAYQQLTELLSNHLNKTLKVWEKIALAHPSNEDAIG
jgi:hypothetical protein